jgi:class 3 adenylate cyclase
MTRPVDPRQVTRTLAMIDIVGSTRLVDAIGDEAWVEVLSWHEQAFGRLIARYAGEIVDQAGDGFFLSFDETSAAIGCAVAIQRVLADHRRADGFALDVRIGLHRASVLRCGPVYRGKGVHVVARITALASAGEILASDETVRAGRIDVPCSSLRTVVLAGISEPACLVPIEWTQDAAA